MGGDAFRAMFFSKNKVVPTFYIDGQVTAPVRVGSWDEGDTSTTNMGNPMEIAFPNFQPRACILEIVYTEGRFLTWVRKPPPGTAVPGGVARVRL